MPGLNHTGEKIKIQKGKGSEKTATTTKKNSLTTALAKHINLRNCIFPVIFKE